MSDMRSAEHDPQPLPAMGDGRDVMRELIGIVERRRSVGIRKYGRTLEPGNGRDALIDARDEAVDLAAYLTQAILERDGAGS